MKRPKKTSQLQVAIVAFIAISIFVVMTLQILNIVHRRAVINQLKEQGVVVFHDDSPRPNWVERTNRFFGRVVIVRMRTPVLAREDWTDLGTFPELQRIDVSMSKFSDDDIHNLKKFRSLSIVDARATQLTSEGVNRIKRLHPDCEVRWFDY